MRRGPVRRGFGVRLVCSWPVPTGRSSDPGTLVTGGRRRRPRRRSGRHTCCSGFARRPRVVSRRIPVPRGAAGRGAARRRGPGRIRPVRKRDRGSGSNGGSKGKRECARTEPCIGLDSALRALAVPAFPGSRALAGSMAARHAHQANIDSKISDANSENFSANLRFPSPTSAGIQSGCPAVTIGSI